MRVGWVVLVVGVLACSRSEPSPGTSGPSATSASGLRGAGTGTAKGTESARSGTEAGAGPGPADAGAGAADLIDIASIDPSIRVEIRYATADNFTGVAFYPVGRCLLRRDAAERVGRVHKALAARGLGLLMWDCYRPFSIQQRLWKIVPDSRYVAEPVAAADGTPVEGSKHNRGAAVDLTLVGRDGRVLEMPTGYDDFSPRAHRGDRRAPAAARRNAELLERAMVAEGFEPLATEWWHFDAPGWQRHPLSDQPLTAEEHPGAHPAARDAGGDSG